MEGFESGTLDGGGEPYIGWSGPGKTFLWGGTAAYEDFETATLSGGGADFGWAGTGVVYFPCVATLGQVFADLGSTATVSVTPTGALSYQWFQNGVALTNGGEYSGVTTSTLTITGVTSSDYTTYFCQVTGLGGTAENSNTVTLIDRATDWFNRTLAHGASPPSGTTVTAYRNLWNGCLTDGYSGKLVSLNGFVLDNLISCITPFVVGPGSDPWINHGFGGSEVTVNGIVGDGSTKYLDTGVVDSSAFASVNDCGVTLYYATSVSENSYPIGVLTADQQTGILLRANSPISHIGASGTGYQPFANYPTGATIGAGYYSFNRTSSTASALYAANSTHPHFTVGTSATAPDHTLVGRSAYIFNMNFNGAPYSVAGFYSSSRLSFAAIHRGLTSSESAAFYARIQAFRTALGGGFV